MCVQHIACLSTAQSDALSVLAKRLARKTPPRKPYRGEGIVSTKPRPKNVYDFLSLL